MDLGRSSSAFERARWLAELAAAIDDAEQTARRLAATGEHLSVLAELDERLRRAKREVEDLRLGGWRAPVQELGSKWIKLESG